MQILTDIVYHISRKKSIFILIINNGKEYQPRLSFSRAVNKGFVKSPVVFSYKLSKAIIYVGSLIMKKDAALRGIPNLTYSKVKHFIINCSNSILSAVKRAVSKVSFESSLYFADTHA